VSVCKANFFYFEAKCYPADRAVIRKFKSALISYMWET